MGVHLHQNSEWPRKFGKVPRYYSIMISTIYFISILNYYLRFLLLFGRNWFSCQFRDYWLLVIPIQTKLSNVSTLWFKFHHLIFTLHPSVNNIVICWIEWKKKIRQSLSIAVNIVICRLKSIFCWRSTNVKKMLI